MRRKVYKKLKKLAAELKQKDPNTTTSLKKIKASYKRATKHLSSQNPKFDPTKANRHATKKAKMDARKMLPEQVGTLKPRTRWHTK